MYLTTVCYVCIYINYVYGMCVCVPHSLSLHQLLTAICSTSEWSKLEIVPGAPNSKLKNSIHLWKSTWNLNITQWKRKIHLPSTSICWVPSSILIFQRCTLQFPKRFHHLILSPLIFRTSYTPPWRILGLIDQIINKSDRVKDMKICEAPYSHVFV